MIGKIFTSAKSKPCSCSSWKVCTKCTPYKKTKGKLKSHTDSEETRHHPVPVIVNYSKQNPITIHDIIKRRRRWKSRKRQHEPRPQRFFDFCKWYKRRKALKQLIKENKKEKERRRREEYEKERIKDILRYEQLHAIEKYEQKLRSVRPLEEKKKEISIKETKYEPKSWTVSKKAKEKTWSIPKKAKKQVHVEDAVYEPVTWRIPAKKQKKKKSYSKEKSATAKPRSVTKHVSVKKYKHKNSLTNRFVNCCYRVCCQFYCCITCILVIAFVVMFIL